MTAPPPKGVKVKALSGVATKKKITLALEVVELEILGVHKLWEWLTGNAISGPTWKKAGNPDKPVCCHRKSKSIKLAPKLTINPAPKSTINVSLRAKSSIPAIVFQKDGVSISGSSTSLSDIPIVSGELEDKVRISSLTLDWSYSTDGGATWIPMNSTGPQKIYLVQDSPKIARLYDFALKKACGYVDGDANSLGKINTEIAKELKYDPAAFVAGHPLKIYDTKTCLCMNNAKLMRYLCRSIGIDATVKYVWGGRAPDEVLFFHSTSGLNYGSFQVIAPVNDLAVKDPHFTYHAETVVGGTTYDPSYGTTGLITLAETAPAASRQTGSAWPPPNTLVQNAAAWKCPH